MKEDVGGVGNYSVAHRQKRMRVAKHLLVARGPMGLWNDEIRHPPRLHLAHEKYPVADPEPAFEPNRIRLTEVSGTETQADGKRCALYGSHDHQTAQSVFPAHGGYVIQTPQGNPVVKPQKENLERLQSEEDQLQAVIRWR